MLPLFPFALAAGVGGAVTGRSSAYRSVPGPPTRAGPMIEKATGRKQRPVSMENRMVPKISAKNVRRIYVNSTPL